MNIYLLKPENRQTKNYIDTLLSFNAIPCITLPTRITSHSATLIDHIIMSKPERYTETGTKCGNLYMEIADHLPNFILINGKRKEPKERPLIRYTSEKNIAHF
jgi:hypothetical protein